MLLSTRCFDPGEVTDATETAGTSSGGATADGSPTGQTEAGASTNVADASGDSGESGTPDGSGTTADDGNTDDTTGPGCVPVNEVCDGEDNDCDGEIDEDDPALGEVCSTGRAGRCDAGTNVCEDGALVCAPDGGATTELCDGLDNDCDDEIDEDNPEGGADCATGLFGACDAGITTCTAGVVECAPIQEPMPEICDGIDNNCNDSIDEGDPMGGALCSTGMPGVCDPGLTSCQMGMLECIQQVDPGPEICDGLDNNCNGNADEGNPMGGAACSTGMPGVCDPGITACQGGMVNCLPMIGPSPELCDGLDNDCNGNVDEGNPEGGAACSVGQPGACDAGTITCSGGALSCVQNQGPIPEICGNGLDDDCDGVVDNGCSCAHSLCESGMGALALGCAPCVDQICAVDAFCCNNDWDAACVNEVSSVCGFADCEFGTCEHSLCEAGTALVLGCDPCVDQICAADAFCCSNSWDGVCVNAVETVCMLTCGL